VGCDRRWTLIGGSASEIPSSPSWSLRSSRSRPPSSSYRRSGARTSNNAGARRESRAGRCRDEPRSTYVDNTPRAPDRLCDESGDRLRKPDCGPRPGGCDGSACLPCLSCIRLENTISADPLARAARSAAARPRASRRRQRAAGGAQDPWEGRMRACGSSPTAPATATKIGAGAWSSSSLKWISSASWFPPELAS
jgi:hypothetical protein